VMLTRTVDVLWVTMDPTVDMAVGATARMFGLSRETVARLLQISLPIVAERAGDNPELLRRLYALSLPALPAPPQEVYDRMEDSADVRQAIIDDYKATVGTMLDAVHRDAARQVGTTDGQAREAFAAMLPAVSLVLGTANRDGSEHGFAQQLGVLTPDHPTPVQRPVDAKAIDRRHSDSLSLETVQSLTDAPRESSR
jgi:hypothetical protein